MPFTHPTAGAAMAGPRSRETGQVHRGRRGFLSSASALAAVTVAAPVAAAVTTCRKGVRRAPGVGGVPEPGTWALMLLGFAGAGAMLKRRGSPARRLRPA